MPLNSRHFQFPRHRQNSTSWRRRNRFSHRRQKTHVVRVITQIHHNIQRNVSEPLDKLGGNFHVHEILCQRRIRRPLVTILKVEMSAFVLKDDSHGNRTVKLIRSIIKCWQVFIVGIFSIGFPHRRQAVKRDDKSNHGFITYSGRRFSKRPGVSTLLSSASNPLRSPRS